MQEPSLQVLWFRNFYFLSGRESAGSIGAAKNLEALRQEGVTHILNASPIVPCFHRQQFKYKIVSIYDDAQEDISQFFEETNKFISKVNTHRDAVNQCLWNLWLEILDLGGQSWHTQAFAKIGDRMTSQKDQ